MCFTEAPGQRPQVAPGAWGASAFSGLDAGEPPGPLIFSNMSRVLYATTLIAMAAAASISSSLAPFSLATARLQSVQSSQPPAREAVRNRSPLVLPSSTALWWVASKNSSNLSMGRTMRSSSEDRETTFPLRCRATR